jgi:hypothetical protein
MLKRLILLLLLPLMTSATLLAESFNPGYNSIDLVYPGATVYFRPFYGTPIEGSSNKEFQPSDMFLNAGTDAGNDLQAVTGDSTAPTVAMYWTLISDTSDANGNIYKIYNPEYKVYIGSATSGDVKMVSDADQAGQYYIKAGTDTAYKKSSSYDETFDLTYYVYFKDVSTGKGLDANCSTRGTGNHGPFTVTAQGLADNGNAYYTVVTPTVDIADATETVWGNMGGTVIYWKPNPNQERCATSSIYYISSASKDKLDTKNYPYGVSMINGKRSMWRLVDAGKYATYYIQNVATGYYISAPTGNQMSSIPMVEDIEKAGAFKAEKTDIGETGPGIWFTYTPISKCYLQLDANSWIVGTWNDNVTGKNSQFAFDVVPEETLDGTLHMQNDIKEGVPQFLRDSKGNNYLTITAEKIAIRFFGMKDTPYGWHSAWTFEDAKATDSEGRPVYYIYNAQREVYLGPTATTGEGVALDIVKEKKDAGRYVVLDPCIGGTYCGFYDVDNPAYGYLKISGSSLVNAADFDYAFTPEEATNTVTYYLSNMTDVILSPLSMGNEGFTNIYTDFNLIRSEKVDATWQGVWGLMTAPGYDRYIDSDNFGHLWKTTDENGNKVDYDATDWPTMAYTLYNRPEQLYMMIDPVTKKVTTTSDANQATCFLIQPNTADDESSAAVGTVAHFAVATNGGSGSNYTATNQYLMFNGTELVAVTTDNPSYNDDSAFYVRAAANTSFDGIYEGAKISLYPFRLQIQHKRMYAKPAENKIYREAVTDPIDHAAYAVWTLVKCKSTDEGASSRTNVLNDDELTDVYYLFNEGAKKYMDGNVDRLSDVHLVDNVADAGRYKFHADNGTIDAVVGFSVDHDAGKALDETTNTYKWLNCSVTSTGGAFQLTGWPLVGSNRLFFVENPLTSDVAATNYIEDGAYITMIPWDYLGDPNNAKTIYPESSKYNEDGGYVYETATGNDVQCDKTQNLDTMDSAYYTWKIVAARDANGDVIPDVFYMVNAKTGNYMASTVGSSTMTTVAANADGSAPAGAGRYTPVLDTDTGLYVAFRDYDTLDNDNYGYIGNDVTVSGSASMNPMELKSSESLTSYDEKERSSQWFNPELGDYQTVNMKYHDYTHTQYWYYIKPVDVTTISTVDKDFLQWTIDNMNPGSGRTVGYFDSVEQTKQGGYVVTYDPETKTYTKTDKYSDDLTFAELANLVMYNYLHPDEVEDQDEAENALAKLRECVKDEEYIIHPRIGRFYEITSPYGFYDGLKLRETYTAKYYNEMQGQQQIHFLKSNIDTDAVTAFWRFDVVDNDESATYKDSNAHHYFHIRAVNSRDVLRRINNTVVADSRPDDNLEAGLFALNKDYNLNVYDGSVLLRSYNNNKERSYADEGSYLGIWSPEGTNDPTEAVVRSGSDQRVEPSDSEQPVGNANNWTITELKEVPIYFWNILTDDTPEDGSANESGNKYYYNTFCFPFTVEIPEGSGLNAYTDVEATSSEGKVSFVEATSNIIPAFQPFVLETTNTESLNAKLKIVYGAGEEYGLYDKKDRYTAENWKKICEDYGISTESREAYLQEVETAEANKEWSMTSIVNLSPYAEGEVGKTNTEISRKRYQTEDSSIVGNICPDPLAEDASAYVIHDDCDNVATLVTEGVHSSYENEEDALYSSSSSYIIPCNSAILILPESTDLSIEDEVVAGTENIQQDVIFNNEPERDANGNLIYFDLYGRRITNPAPGIYILTNGRKVVVRN